MLSERDISRDKTVGDLAREAAWFLVHTVIAFLLLTITLGLISLNHPDPDATTPKFVGTALTFLVPMFGGFLAARIQRSKVASYTWISGVAVFASVCVWVLDLPTGPGLCETCSPFGKLWRTFFSLTHGSGLMGGDGVLIGTWIPLAMIGYAAGARLALEP
ncbi:MAG: hypothetical protein M3Y50_11725 [Acidobacteriota bacterium]|nr:hypothetical protein [Acidobacteriota bacterium]